VTLSRWLRIARSNRPPHLTGRKEGSSDGAYNSLVGNAASGTSTTRVTLQPTVGTCERRASGFAAAGGNDADDGGATHSGGSRRGARGGPRQLRAEISRADRIRNPGPWTTGDGCCPTRSHSRDSSNTWSAGRPHQRRGARPRPPVRDPRAATDALYSSARTRRNVRGGFGAGGLLG
jgi:hypothetical protein